MALSIFSVQGVTYLAQLFLAGVLPTNQFAVVRTVEAALQIFSTVAPMGVSLMVVRLASQSNNSKKNGDQLASYLAFTAIAGLGTASIVSMSLSVFGSRLEEEYCKVLIWMVLLTNLSRSALNFLQGKEKFAVASIVTFLLSIAYLVALPFFVRKWQLDGWVMAKYAVEALYLAISLFLLFPYLRNSKPSISYFREFLSEGPLISFSLVFRSVIDNSPLLVVSYLSMSSENVANFGMCTLLVAAGMILPTSINAVLLPKYGHQLSNGNTLDYMRYKSNLKILFMASLVSIIGVLAAGVLVHLAINTKYFESLHLLLVCSIVLPIKSFTTLHANILFLNGQTATGTKINLTGAASGVLIASNLFHWFGIEGVALSMLFVEVGIAVAFRQKALKLFRPL